MAIKCSYADCSQNFDTEKAMINHKKQAPEHHYCSKCKVDCLNDLELLIHQMGSKKHVCCPMCGLDFKSTSGRTRHLEYEHPAKQAVGCVGCQKKFDRASGLMAHIEKNECHTIKSHHFVRQRAEKELEQDAWEAVYDPWIGSGVAWSNAMKKDTTAETTWDSTTSENLPDTTKVIADINDWPLPGTNTPVAVDPVDSVDSGVDQVMELLQSLSINESNSNAAPIEKNHQLTMFEKFTGYSSTMDTPFTTNHSSKSYHGKIQLAPHIEKSIEIENRKYFDQLIGKYICPGKTCRRHINTAEEFKNHLITDHNPTDVSCPICHKRFRSTAALVSHCESPTKKVKCKIRERKDYDQLLRKITAGIIGTDGKMYDGTAKYVEVAIADW